jgi:hypothetical protein
MRRSRFFTWRCDRLGPVNETRTKSSTYQLVVRGDLDPRCVYLFDGIQMRHAADLTIMTGRIIDQAQLHGFIDRVEELGLELLSVEQLSYSLS